MNDNKQFLNIVGDRIGRAVVEFCTRHQGHEWHADDLRRYVDFRVGVVAPGSADRILRSLRAKGKVVYECVSRSKSLYRVISVKGAA